MTGSFQLDSNDSLATRALACSNLQQPFLNGTEILTFSAQPYSQYVASPFFEPFIAQLGGVTTANVSYCNVTMTYTHPNQNDAINLQIWLPDNWNGRFQGTGGSGWRGGIFDLALVPAIVGGYAAASTDAGHSIVDSGTSTWALSSPGNVDFVPLKNFGSIALNELAVFGKAVTAQFYEKEASYS